MTPVVTADELGEVFRRGWAADTSSDPSWSCENPELGQCAVTALLVQEWLGGELLRARVGEVSHYWNRTADGAELDLTRAQFEVFEPEGIEVRTRDYVLSFPETRRRHDLLRRRTASLLHLGGVEVG